jgi:DMSO/TMAO reductase YedYZ molybdopterin-dependent catalytic subunit
MGLSLKKKSQIEDPSKAARIPPGQSLTEKFPVLTYGPVPGFDPKTWDFKIFGLVEQPVRFSYQEFISLPKIKVMADFHCVTAWSRLDNEWEGVGIKEVMKHVKLKPEAKFVMAHCDGGYTTNLPLGALLDDDVLLAYKHDGQNMTPEHGWPLRLVVPKRYAWKSAKWVRGLEFMDRDRPGFWERYGYHNDGDPWKEERYG